MNMEITCTRCGGKFPADQVNQRFQGTCPKCLAGVVLNPTEPTSPPEPLPLSLGASFHGLEVIELLGQGGMGVVYKARQPGLDRFVALKILPKRLAEDPDFVQRFKREAKALAALSHPSIVGVHDFGTESNLCFLVMEYVDGVNLREILRDRRLSPEEAIRIVPQLCDALQYAHQEGVVHRDIKPENILVDKKARVKISDFGLAKIVGGDATQPGTITRTDAMMGTPAYMAPEQIEHPKDVDHRADIYSMGVVFYEMLTGELPIGRFEPPSHKARIDVRIDEIVLKTLEKQPERRYQHASEVKEDVSKFNVAEARKLSLGVAGLLGAIALAGLVGTGMLAVGMILGTGASAVPLIVIGLASGILAGWLVGTALASGKPTGAIGLVLALSILVMGSAYLFGDSDARETASRIPWAILALVIPSLLLSMPALRRARARSRTVVLGTGALLSFEVVFCSMIWATGLLSKTEHRLSPPVPVTGASWSEGSRLLEKSLFNEGDLPPGYEFGKGMRDFPPRSPFFTDDAADLAHMVKILDGKGIHNVTPAQLKRLYWVRMGIHQRVMSTSGPDLSDLFGFFGIEAADGAVTERIAAQAQSSTRLDDRWVHRMGTTTFVAYSTEPLRFHAEFQHVVNRLSEKLGVTSRTA
jgi:tRNA A-37 threonylcarbamoyl transferase component Bud32